jgi:hypothetical protein
MRIARQSTRTMRRGIWGMEVGIGGQIGGRMGMSGYGCGWMLGSDGRMVSMAIYSDGARGVWG